MKRFEFRLERVLKVKQQQQRLAELRQQQARFRVETAHAEVAAGQHQIQELAAALDSESGRETRQELRLAHFERSRLLGQSLAAAEDRSRKAEYELHQADAQRQTTHLNPLDLTIGPANQGGHTAGIGYS